MSINLYEIATDKNFSEESYLAANPDVASALKSGVLASAKAHFERFGKKEGRRIRLISLLVEPKRVKLERIRPLLRDDLPCIETGRCWDFLSPELRQQFNIIDTNAVSSHNYDKRAQAIIEQCATGIVLDCGAGRRPVYYENVVNFEIADYDTTDVRGVGEVLPFRDNSFDAVLSLSVLEHVKDPFKCAREIVRVLKPGGLLMCSVPFLQPQHGFPHHYYNMTSQGLVNLFAETITVEKVEVYGRLLPISSLTWILKSWAAGLKGKTKEDFMQMRVADLVGDVGMYMKLPFVSELSEEKNFELASSTVLLGRK